MKQILAGMLLVLSHATAWQPAAPEPFKRSDPALLSATGRPQLVEVYHPG